ncbi:response regulator [bacterium]|nr:response regulator [bacterium]
MNEEKEEFLQSLTILCVEAEEELRDNLVSFLKPKVKTLLCANNGKDGFERFKKQKVDFVIFNVQIPDGLEMAKKIRYLEPEIPIILTTDFVKDSILLQSLKIEIDKFISKPTDQNLLLNSILQISKMLLQKQQIKNFTKTINFQEQEIKRNKEYLSVVMKNVMDCVVTVDGNGEIVFVNKIAENLVGFNEAEIIGKHFCDVFSMTDEKTGKPCSKTFLEDVKNSFCAILTKDGTKKIISKSISPIATVSGKNIGAIIVFRDITEKRKMEEELLRVEKLESISLLAGGIAHDFNNLLTAICGNITLAKIFLSPTETKVLQRLQEAEKTSFRAVDLTKQLLAFSKNGAPIKSQASVMELLKESAYFDLSGSNVKCDFSIPENIWKVEVDEGQICQVIDNLIINASQAMPNGGKIEIICENVYLDETDLLPLPNGNYVKISITDNGIGIPKANLKKIFDPYFTTKEKGNGLGLPTCFAILQKHNGYITVESEVGIGTTFLLYIPASFKEEELSKNNQGVFLPQSSSGKGKILLMDDEEIIREVAGNILDYIGYETYFAKDGKEAIELYKKFYQANEPFDIVILDLTIPGGMGAKETIKKLFEFDPKVKAIASSGYLNDPLISNFQKYHFKGAVTKPFTVKDLSEILSLLIGEEKKVAV